MPVRFVTRKPEPRFNEQVEIRTNDPQQEMLALLIRGYVWRAVRPSVNELALGSISRYEETLGSFRLYAYASDRLQLIDYEFSNPPVSGHFTLESRQLRPEQYANEPRAKAALDVTITVSPGLPFGSVDQMLLLTLEADETSVVEVPVRGTVEPDISLLASGQFDKSTHTLRLSAESGTSPAKVQLRVMVKGPYRERVELDVQAVQPPSHLRVSVGDVKVLAGGAIRLYLLTIEVVSEIDASRGNPNRPWGEVVLSTGHPHERELALSIVLTQ